MIKKTSVGQGTTGLPPSGLDCGKMCPISLFYLPCQAKDRSQSFFKDYKQETRKIIDPFKWLRNSVIPFPTPSTSMGHGPRQPRPKELNKAAVEEARSIWRESKSHPGEGNDRFWNFALALRSAGMSDDRIQSELNSEYMYGRSPKERKAQRPWNMASLKRLFKKTG
jgi:hypothetical protein